MRNLALLLVLMAGAAGAAEKKTDVQLLRIGTFHGEEVTAESGEKWFALRKTAEGYALEEVEIAVDAAFDALLDYDPKKPEDKSKKSGKEVSILGEDRNAQGYQYPIILVRGDNLKAGPLETAFPTDRHRDEEYRALGNFAPRPSLWMELGKRNYQLELQIAWSWKEQKDDKCELSLSSQNPGNKKYVRQLIGEQFPPDSNWREIENRKTMPMACIIGDGFPELLWAGDLDRDGKLDMLLAPRYHYNNDSTVLFLSGPAGEDELVKRVAEFTATGC